MSNHPTLDRQRCCKVVTFRSILPALVFIVALNLSYLVLKGPTPNAILAYGYLWNALFLAFPLAHVIARRASLRELGYRGGDHLRLYARGAAVGAVWRFFDILTGYYQVFTFLGTAQFLTGLLFALTLALLFEDTFFHAYLQVGLEERLRAAGASWCRLSFLLSTPATLRKAGDISRLYFSSASSPG